MKLIVGLGNPGREYASTRHNVGFMVLDRVLAKLSLKLDKEKFKALYTICEVSGQKVAFMKPLTYMNLSGEAVSAFVNYYGLNSADVLVIHDDLDLPLGKLRLRMQGSSGGQKGMDNIIKLLGTKEIKRIRVGIANDKQIDTKDYVLGKVSGPDLEIFEGSLDRAAEAVLYYLGGATFEKTMNGYNG